MSVYSSTITRFTATVKHQLYHKATEDKLSLEELAGLCEISASDLCDWLEGVTFDFKQGCNILEKLGMKKIEIGYIFNEEGKEQA